MAAPESAKLEGCNFSFPQLYLNQAASSAPSPAPVSSSAPAPAPVSSSASSSAPLQPSSSLSTECLPEHLMHKNHLQNYTQRSNIARPLYQTVNEGSQHAPRFRSTVWVDGVSYTSRNVFSNRKSAEQDVAKLAMEYISEKIRNEGCPETHENPMFCKSILNEYAVKLNLERPTYNTVQQKSLLPAFVSSLVFNGTKYTGEAARNKKEAEQLAARAVIHSILGKSASGTVLSEIIKSKAKLYAVFEAKDSTYVDARTVSPIANIGHTSVTLDHNDKEVPAPVAANNNETEAALPESSSRMLPSLQEFQMTKQEPSPESTKLSNVSLQPGSKQPIGDGPSLKRRKKNKKKANKKSRFDSPSQVTAVSLNQAPPCSVAE